MNALVVPSNSPERVARFLEAWDPWPWDRIIVVQDAPEVDLRVPEHLRERAVERLEVVSWTEIDAALAEPSIISRQDSAIRSFGFWRAWQAGAELIFTLDDDCFRSEDDLVTMHRNNLFATPAWSSSVAGMHVRGLPYRNRGRLSNVFLSMGLWQGCPDLDAVSTLAAREPASIGRPAALVMPATQYLPMSGMNLCFRREVACLMYFAPMGRGQPYRRFDDIWAGIVVQRIFRHLGYAIVFGRPLVDHRRASDPFVNLVKEAPGLAFNEHLWETIDAVELNEREPRGCMAEMGRALAACDEDYVAAWGRAIGSWCALFEPVPEQRTASATAGP